MNGRSLIVVKEACQNVAGRILSPVQNPSALSHQLLTD
jgi:hypothetical protein